MLGIPVFLSEMKEGERGVIESCKEPSLQDLGIRAGTEVLAVGIRKSGGVFIIGGRRFGISRSLFHKILIKRIG